MSNAKNAFTLQSSSDNEAPNQNKVTGPNKIELLNGLKGLNIGAPENKPLTLGQANGGFSLNDLANAHLNQTSLKGSNAPETSSLKLNLDFNNLKIGQPTVLASSSTTPFGQSSISLSDTKTLPNISLSTLAKEHEINKPNCVASSSGFKIPSLFGNPGGSSDTGSHSISFIKDSTGSTKPSIDLSSAILTKEERALKSISPEMIVQKVSL